MRGNPRSPPERATCSRGLLEFSAAAFETLVVEQGGRPVHARVLRRGALRRGLADLGAVGSRDPQLPRDLCRRLAGAGVVALVSRVEREQRAADGCIKLGVRLRDGQAIECVILRRAGTGSVCVSTQVGCPVGCPFCASGLGGLVRNLEPVEILEQFAHASRLAPVDRAVVMGVGEPLLNLDRLMEALAVVTDEMPLPDGRVTISTVGWPHQVARLTEGGRRFSLAISLHAPDDETRARLVPSMRDVPVQEVVTAAQDHARRTRGRIQFEYVVLPGINDDEPRIRHLAHLLSGVPGFVNFIPWNPVPGLPFEPPTEQTIERLVRLSRNLGLLATSRHSQATDIQGACGQLRHSLLKSSGAG